MIVVLGDLASEGIMFDCPEHRGDWHGEGSLLRL